MAEPSNSLGRPSTLIEALHRFKNKYKDDPNLFGQAEETDSSLDKVTQGQIPINLIHPQDF